VQANARAALKWDRGAIRKKGWRYSQMKRSLRVWQIQARWHRARFVFNRPSSV